MGLDADLILSIKQLSFITSIEPALKTFISSRVCMKLKGRLSAAWLDKRPDITILSEYIFLSQSNEAGAKFMKPLNAKRSIKRAQSGVTYWQLKLHNSETDRKVSFKFCGNYLLQGTCAALFTKSSRNYSSKILVQFPSSVFRLTYFLFLRFRGLRRRC